MSKENKSKQRHLPSKKVTKPKFIEADLRTEKDEALDLAVKVHQKFDKMIKSSILFGSQVKQTSTVGSDIDIIFVIDDASINWDLELISWYREELGKIISSTKRGSEFHINTIKLTTWWQDLLQGDPVIINILRYGEALIDSGGFFNPIKALLLKGFIHSTPEAVYAALQRAPTHLVRSKASELGAIEGVYWTMIDAAQAALIMAGKIPPSPEHIPGLLKETFVDNGMLKMNYINDVKEVYHLHKAIAHSEISAVKGSDIDRLQASAESFLSEMTRIINNLIDSKK